MAVATDHTQAEATHVQEVPDDTEIYAGMVCWYLTRKVQRKLNHWSGAKMAAITGHSHKYENAKRRVDVVALLRYYRRRLLGYILRSRTMPSKMPSKTSTV